MSHYEIYAQASDNDFFSRPALKLKKQLALEISR